ncbi:helix-turn-helix transcriptional regulator [Vibrio parahaemolyticus]|uniref:helix-turn-helix transcriptional regulator n=1 Tax=Vibrio parahaemolyticus TaxID=670 RepID=UPI001C55C95D|nr:AlpA family phage regulatory protein [Vibrio parahaemolyticus]
MNNIKQIIPLRLIRMNELTEMLNYHKSSINNLIQEGRFPQRIKISTNASAWLLPEVHAWINQTWKEGDSFSPRLIDSTRLLTRQNVLNLLGIKKDTLNRMIKRKNLSRRKGFKSPRASLGL